MAEKRTFKNRMFRLGIFAASCRPLSRLALFAGSLYVGYRYLQIRRFEKDFKEIVKDKYAGL